MSKRLMVLVVVVGVLVAVAAALAAPPAPTVKAVQQVAKVKLPDPPAWKHGVAHPTFKFMPGAMKVLTPQTVKKQIFCGVFYPPAYTNVLFFINNTGQVIPPGAVVQWTLQGENGAGQPQTFSGYTNPSHVPWGPNPPTEMYWPTGPLPNVVPLQHWSRPCQAWAILP